MARFEEHTLEEIRTRLNLVDVIGEYVQLKKTGSGYQGLCPFHSEKTPSFHVHAEKQIFHCFGCHKGGNAFTFLMAVEGWNFPETVKKLAERTGVDLPKQREFVPQQRPQAVVAEESRLYAANEWAAKYYNYLLTQGKDRRGFDYLKGRGLTDKTIEKFKLGLAPTGWNNLITQMTKRGFTFEELTKAGLVVVKEDSPNGGYDRFRERVMFPIHDKDGHVIGFGARLLEDDPKQPKYLNSSESALFSKRGTLYGLFENQRGIRLKNEAIVVEGYMDVVGLSQAGVQNAVATMGTAFTEEHCTLLRGLTRKVVTVFDPDKAGTDAARRSVHVFLEAGIFAKDLELPDELDPDEYVLKHSAEKFYELCERAPRQVTKFLKEIAGQGALSEEQRAHWLERLTPVLVASRRLPDRALLWDNISLVLQLSVESLAAVAEGARARQTAATERRTDDRRPGPRQGGRPVQGPGQQFNPRQNQRPNQRQNDDEPPPPESEFGPPTQQRSSPNPKWKEKGEWQKSKGFGRFQQPYSDGGGYQRKRGFQNRDGSQQRDSWNYSGLFGEEDVAGLRRAHGMDRKSPEQLMELEFFMAAASCPEGLHIVPPALWQIGFADRKLARYLDALMPKEGEAFTQQLAELLAAETDADLLDKTSSLIFTKDAPPKDGAPKAKPAELISIAERILEQRKTKQIQAVTTQVKLAQRIGNEKEQLELLEKLKALRAWQPKLEEMSWLFAQAAAPLPAGSPAGGLAPLAKPDAGN